MSNIYGPRIVTDGLVLCLDAGNRKSYPGSGTTWYDLSGGNNNVNLTDISYNQKNKGILIFDNPTSGIGSSVKNLDLSNTNKITICCWIRIISYIETLGSSKLIFELTNNFNSSAFGLYFAYAEDSHPIFQNTYPVSVNLKGNIGYNLKGFDKNLVNDLKYHFWCCIFDKSLDRVSEVSFYLDSIKRIHTILPQDGQLSRDNTNNFGSTPFNIGRRPGANNGGNFELSNFFIYNRVLSEKEIQQNYNALKGRYDL